MARATPERKLARIRVPKAAILARRNRRVNELERAIASLPQQEIPVTHTFTPGLYTRCVVIPAGTLLTSKIHKTEHPFVIIKGDCAVWTEDEGVQRIVGPFSGITKEGTRRVIYTHTETIWMTFHPTKETDLGRIEKQLILKHDPGFALDRETVAALQHA